MEKMHPAGHLVAMLFLATAPIAGQNDTTSTEQDAKPAQKPDPEVERIRKLIEQAHELRRAGHLEQARTTVRDALAACLALPKQASADAHDALWYLGNAAYQAQDLHTAREAWSRVLTHRERTLPDDHPDVQMARTNLGNTKFNLGDLAGARALLEKVLAVMTRTLPDDHPDLQSARLNLASAILLLGDLAKARKLQEKVLAARTKTLPDEHRALQFARANLAVTLYSLGDLAGARALLEKVLAVFTKTLPDEHPNVQAVRTNLAATIRDLGDLAGARALQEKVLAAYTETLPDEHPDLQQARISLASTLSALGDLAGARALQGKALAVCTETLPDEHPNLMAVRGNLANTLYLLGDLTAARALQERELAVRTETLPDDHPNLQKTRTNLASTLSELGDLAGARALQEKVLAVVTETLPDDHPDVQRARGNLAITCARLGDAERAQTLARTRGAAARHRIAAWLLAPRERGALAQAERPAVDLLLTFAQGLAPMPPHPELAVEALLTSQTLVGVETRSARDATRAREVDDTAAAQLEVELRAASDEVSRVAGTQVAGEGEARAMALRAHNKRLTAAVREKERLQRALAALAARAGVANAAAVTVQELAALLPERGAAVAVVGYSHIGPDPARENRTLKEDRLAALILDRAGAVTLASLGTRRAVEERVGALRAQVGAGRDRGLRPQSEVDPLTVQKELRELVLDPILAACGDVDAVFMATDEALQLVPLDALAREDGEPIGTAIALRPLVSLFDLLEEPTATVPKAPTLLAFGDIDYDERAQDTSAVVGNAIAPPVEPPLADTRAGRPNSFGLLSESGNEIKRVARYFERTFDGSTASVFSQDGARKATLLEHAPRAHFVHLATHGYFAPESVKSHADRDDDVLSRVLHANERLATGLSPLVLCGLALSGANLPPSATGRVPGIITAEEILSIDLSNCYLVTLSACDTSLGVQRAGQGYASLRAALLGAGARYALTSLWKVGDEATMELMTDFYRRLWRQKKDPHVALWEAKLEARRKGASFRDWAGWVLTGR